MKLKIAALFLVLLISIIAYRRLDTPAIPEPQPALPFTAATIELPDNVVRYLKNSLIYGNYYNESRRFVIYYDSENKHIPAFKEAINKIINNPVYREEYSFIVAEAVKDAPLSTDEEKMDNAEFYMLCSDFCVINPFRNEIFYISNVGEDDTKEFSHIFDSLESW